MDDIVGRIKREQEKDSDFPNFKTIEWPATGPDYEWVFPQRYSPEYYRAQKALLGSYAWAALYMCNPVPREGNIIKTDKIKIISREQFERMTVGLSFARGWDLASGEKSVKSNPDFTSGCKLAIRWAQTNHPDIQVPIFFIADYVRGQWEALKRNHQIVQTAIADGEITVGVEAFAAYKDAYTTIKSILKGLRMVRKSHLPGDKVSKAEIVAPAFEAGNVYMVKAEWNDDVIKQYAQFPGGVHDDDIDSLVVAYDILQKNTEFS
jgi:predicted phage terminase large subunit-like protein